MYQVSSSFKLCATCSYWIGPRLPNYFATHVELDNQSAKGKCWCIGGPWARAERSANSTACARYEKWTVLK